VLDGGLVVEHPFYRMAFVDALEVGFALGDSASVERRLEEFRRLKPSDQLPFRAAQVLRFEALLAVRSGDTETGERKFRRAAAVLRELDVRFWLAAVLLEHGEWLSRNDGFEEAEPLLEEAREIFERLDAKPYLERLEAVAEPARV
jgi:hypothetical protein